MNLKASALHVDQSTKFDIVFWLAILISGIIATILFLGFFRWAYDDPFISYRYADNLSKGIGFVYNPGERILSTTTPLFTVLLALIGLVSSEFHFIATSIGIISLAVGGFFIFDIARTFNTPIVGWAGLLLYPTSPLVVSTLGSETPIYLAFCLGAFAFYARKNLLAAGIFGVLATLARPDGVLVLAILGADYLFRGPRAIPWKPIIISGALMLGWILFAWVYFGSPIPATLAAKQQQGAMAISELFAQGMVTIVKTYSSQLFYLEVILALGGIIYAVWKKRPWVLLLIWPFIYFISYSILGVTRYFWYYAPLIPGYVIAVGLGLAAVSESIKFIFQENPKFSAFSFLIPGFLLVILLATNGQSLWRLSNRNDPRFGIYKAAGDWLRENTLPKEQVGSLEVGILGYYAERPMVDFAGLIQPDVAEQFSLTTTYEDAAFWAVENLTPEYLVLHDGLFSQLEEEYVKANCEKVTKLIGEQYSYAFDLTIYECR